MPRLSRSWLVVAVLFLIAGLNYGDRTAISSVFPLIRADLGLSDIALAAIGSVFLWTYAIGSPIAGAVADRMSRSRVILWSLAAWSVATALTGFTHSVSTMLGTRVLLGLAECFYLPAAVALIADHFEPRTRATAMGIHIAGLNAGLIAGGFTAGYLGDHFGWRINFFVLGAAGVILAIVARGFLQDAPQLGASPVERTKPNPLDAIRLLREPVYAAIAVQSLLISTATWMFFNWLPLYFHETYGMSLAASGFSGTFTLQTAAMLGSAGGGYFSDKITGGTVPRRLLFMACCYLVAAPCLWAFLARPSVGLVSAAIFGYSLVRSVASSNEHPIVCTLLEPNLRSSAIGLMNTVNCLAGGTGVLIAGALKRDFGLAGVFAGVSSVVLMAAGIVLVAWARRRSAPGLSS
jgi:predicted MFS family arabinose efflux permease